MNKFTKSELWRNQTLVNRINSNDDIAREYYTLVMYIVKEYPRRMESVQAPLLHLVSHCLELSLKAVIDLASHKGYVSKPKDTIEHSHSLIELISFVLQVFKRLSKEQSLARDDKDLFDTIFPKQLNELGKILRAQTPTYRYAYKLDRRGVAVASAIPVEHDYESPNILEVSELFDYCYSSLSYTAYCLKLLFPE